MATHTGAIILGLTPFFVVPKAKELGVGLGLDIGVLVPWETGVSVNEGTGVSVNEGTGVLVSEGTGVLVDEGTGFLVNGIPPGVMMGMGSRAGTLAFACSIPLSGRDLDIVFVARPVTTGFGIAVNGVLVRGFKSPLIVHSHLKATYEGLPKVICVTLIGYWNSDNSEGNLPGALALAQHDV